MDIEKIRKFLKDNNQPNFRLKQILQAVYQDGVSSFGEITTLPKALGHEMSQLDILSFKVEKVLESNDSTSVKVSLRLKDNNFIETVLLWPARKADACTAGKSVCVSTQVGCPMNCGFCATGKSGFKRNLTAEEITDQVLFWKQYLRKSQITNLAYRQAGHKSQTNSKFKKQNSKFGNWDLEIGNYNVSNIVYMGMGEPFLNWEEVKKSLEILTDKNLFGFGSRSISVSTSGIPEGIINFAKDFPQMNLALSLHFANDQKRSEFMPINRKYNLDKLKKSLQEYFTITKRKVFVEYIMLDGINDSQDDAENLVQYLQSIGNTHLLHVNLIGYNSAKKGFDPSRPQRLKRVEPLRPSSSNKTHAFMNYLAQNKINATIRKSLGEEIQGACGQLAGDSR